MRVALKFGTKLFQAEGLAEIDTGRQEYLGVFWKQTMSMEQD